MMRHAVQHYPEVVKQSMLKSQHKKLRLRVVTLRHCQDPEIAVVLCPVLQSIIRLFNLVMAGVQLCVTSVQLLMQSEFVQ